MVPVGGGQALIIRNATVDKTTTLLDIETGTETAIYNGSSSFSLSSFWFIQAAYDANYKSTGVSMTRLAFGAETTDYQGGTTDYMLEIKGTAASSVTDADFKIRSLADVIYGTIVSGRDPSYSSGYKILGFAGSDYLITTDVSFIAQSGGYTGYLAKTYNLYAHRLDVSPVTTASLSTAFQSAQWNTLASNGQNWADGVARAKGVRGNGGRLYVYMNNNGSTISYNSTTPSLSGGNYGYQIAVIDATGSLLSQTTTTNAYVGPLVGTFAMAPSIALSTASNGQERMLAVIPTYYGNSTYPMNMVQQQLTFTSAGVASVYNGQLGIVGATSGSANYWSSADLTSSPQAPVNGKLGSYFNKFGTTWVTSTANALAFYQSSIYLQSSPGQERRTNGVFFGNAAGWYYPTGLFVEKRQYNDFGLLNATNSVVQTNVLNPVQAIASTTKLLVVGVDGCWEIVTP